MSLQPASSFRRWRIKKKKKKVTSAIYHQMTDQRGAAGGWNRPIDKAQTTSHPWQEKLYEKQNGFLLQSHHGEPSGRCTSVLFTEECRQVTCQCVPQRWIRRLTRHFQIRINSADPRIAWRAISVVPKLWATGQFRVSREAPRAAMLR